MRGEVNNLRLHFSRKFTSYCGVTSLRPGSSKKEHSFSKAEGSGSSPFPGPTLNHLYMWINLKNTWGRFAHLLSRVSSLRVFKTFPIEIGHGIVFGLAAVYRLALNRVMFIGITGSTGKTNTKELIAAVLSSRLQGRQNLGLSYNSGNLPYGVANTILRVRPWDNFFVQEVAAGKQGNEIGLDRSARLLKPQMGVVTNIGSDHLSEFRTLEATAEVKGRLIAALPQHGTAVLNADDPYVMAMTKRNTCKVVTYGLGSDAMLRAIHIQCTWPERLSFTVVYNGETYPVHTQLVGTHWAPCVLAAFAVGVTMGVPLATAVEAVQSVEPVNGRLCPEFYPNEITFIRDDVKAPLWSIPPALKIMKDAKAKRKIVVIGTISDYAGNSDRKYQSVARQALDVADHVVFVGPRASKCLKARKSPQDETLQAFYSVEAAREYLNTLLQPGDVVLLKASDADGFRKIKPAPPNEQDSRQTAHAFDSSSNRSMPISQLPANGSALISTSATTPRVRAIVGLGNAGQKYRDTPHNVGKRVLALLAKSLNGEWTQEDQAMVARVEYKGNSLYLIDPLTYVNVTGPVLLKLSQRLGISSSEYLLVHDDADLPFGRVRARAKGGDGGHRGLRSIFKAFRTEEFHRIKIGVGRTQGKDLGDHVLAEFSATDLPVVETACQEASRCVLEIIEEPTRPQPRIN